MEEAKITINLGRNKSVLSSKRIPEIQKYSDAIIDIRAEDGAWDFKNWKKQL